MTITEPPPAPPDPELEVAPAGGPELAGPQVEPTASARAGEARWQVAELGLLAGLAVAAGLVFVRVLPAGQLVGRVTLAAVVATAVSWASRRWQPDRLGLSLGATLVAYVVTTGLVLFRPDTLAGLPTPASTHAVFDAVTNGAARILTSAVPAPPVAAALIIPLTVAWVVAWAGSELAGRVRSPLLPALPGLLGFSFGLLFGGPDALVGLTAAFVALAAALGVVRARSTGDRFGPVRRLVAVGLPLVVVLALVAAAAVAALGVSSDQVDLHERHPATQTFAPAITPLSQLQGQLLTQPAVDLFQVTVPAGAADLLPNWRLTVLDHFDGSQWSSPETYVPAGGTLPAGETIDATTTQVHESVTVDHLSGVWLPVAGQATRTSLTLVDVGASSGSLALAAGTRPGLRYQVQATVAQYPAAVLADATPQGGGEDTALPDTAPDDLAVIRDEAALVTRPGTTPSAKLALLQSYLRTDHFTSTPQSDAGQSYARIADFLHKHRVGTAEQFATAFVLMARSLGYPARVAVGFRRSVASGGRFTVTSADAYAWPEVHFATLGWVPFDPTPDPTGSAAPGAPVVPVTTPGSSGAGATQLVPEAGGSSDEVFSVAASKGVSPAQVLALVMVGLIVLALVGTPMAVVGLKRRRLRQRRQADGAAARVVGAWRQAIDQVRQADVAVPASLTNSEVVSTAWVHLGPDVADAMGTLRTLANLALFADEAPSPAQADQAWVAADQVAGRVREKLSPARRLLAAVDPRPLWAGRSARSG